MIKDLDKLIAQYEKIGKDIELAQDELVSEAKKEIGDKVPSQEYLAQVVADIARKNSIDPVYATKVVECEINFSMDAGVLIDNDALERQSQEAVDDIEVYLGNKYDECKGWH